MSGMYWYVLECTGMYWYESVHLFPSAVFHSAAGSLLVLQVATIR
jgi:hypothetical protein